MKRTYIAFALAGLVLAIGASSVLARPGVTERHARLSAAVPFGPTLGFDNRLAPFPDGPFVREPLYFPPSGIFFGHYPPDRIIHPANPPFFNFHQPPFMRPISPPSVVFPPGERVRIIIVRPQPNAGTWWW